jgi:hypothetical protein
VYHVGCVNVLVSKLRSDEQEARLENAKTRSNRNRVKILDLQRLHFLLLVVDGNLVEISLFAL